MAQVVEWLSIVKASLLDPETDTDTDKDLRSRVGDPDPDC
jgi:hypothetical protein